MSPRTKQQYEEIRKSSKGKIMSVALKLFVEKGYHASSISQIAAKAKVSKGLMYNYFDSKEKLLEEIILEGFNALTELEYEAKRGDTAEEQLKNFVDSVLTNLYSNFSYWQLYLTLLVHPVVQRRFERRMTEFRDEFVSYLSNIFKRLGSKEPELDAFLLGTFFDGLVLNFIAAEDAFPIEKIKKALLNKYIKTKPKSKK
jgi:AcrR family transcriptional regulator